MPSIVATTSTPARKPFVRTHYIRTNIEDSEELLICVEINSKTDNTAIVFKKFCFDFEFLVWLEDISLVDLSLEQDEFLKVPILAP